MIPTGGLSVFLHLLVNIYGYVAKHIPGVRKLKRFLHIPAPVMGLVLISVIIYFASSLFWSALNNDNNFDHLSFLLDSCEDRLITPGERSVILRVDDIQAYAWTDISRRIIDDALAYDMPLSLAVIPVGLREDYAFYEYLREQRCDVEFMLHGWDNQEPRPTVGEFAELSKAQARERLEKGINVIDRLSRRPLVTFVPPLNQMSNGTKEALDELKFEVVSLEGEAFYDYDATTFDFDIDELVSAEEVLSQCEVVFANGDALCVIMIHPQDFATAEGVFDAEKYQTYTELLAGLDKADYTAVRFKDYVSKELSFSDKLRYRLGL